MTIWDIVGGTFKKTENWGKPEKINGALLLVLERIRNRVGAPMHINNSYRPDGEGQHPKGNAVDFYFKGISYLEACVRLEQAIKELQLENHIGLGIYLDWNIRGFHLDVRGERARWSRIDGKYESMAKGIKELLAEQTIPDPRFAKLSF